MLGVRPGVDLVLGFQVLLCVVNKRSGQESGGIEIGLEIAFCRGDYYRLHFFFLSDNSEGILIISRHQFKRHLLLIEA